jgi:hypothetical protein
MGPNLKARDDKSLIWNLQPEHVPSNCAACQMPMSRQCHKCGPPVPRGAMLRIFPTLTISWNNSVTW